MVSATPGKIETHGASVTKARPSAIIAPQLGIVGGMPIPRNVSGVDKLGAGVGG